MELDVDVEARAEPVDRDLDLHLREAREELLAGLRIAAHDQGRVLLVEAAEAGCHLLLVALRLRRDREAQHGLGEVDVRRLDRDLVVDEHVAGDDVLELRHRAEVADAERLDGLRVLALQQEHLSEPLLRVRARVDQRRVARDRAGENPEAADAAGERVGDRLEDEHGLLRVAELDRRPFLRRRRDALDEQVEERRRTEVLRRDAARDRIQLVPGHRLLERVGDRLRVELLSFEVAPHELLVGLDDGVEELLAVLLHEVGHRVGDRLRPAFAPAGGIHVRAHVEEIDDPAELVLAADRKLDRDAAVGQLLARRLEHAEEVGALAVEHVDEETRESSCCSARCHTRAVLTSTPITPLSTTTTPSTTRSAANVSAWKPVSPGVSIRLIFRSFHSRWQSAPERDIARFCSCSSQSETVVPCSTLPSRLIFSAS